MPRTDDDVVVDLRDGNERDRMVTAAWAVLERSGWDGLKVDRVLTEVGLSTRCFYRHFANKNDLLAVMVEQDVGLLGDLLDVSLASRADPVGRVAAWMTDLVGVSGTANGLDHVRFCLTNFRSLGTEFPDFVRRCEDRLETPLAGVIEDGTRRGCFNSADPRLDAHVVTGLAIDILAGRLSGTDPDIDAVRLDGVIRFALQGLSGSLDDDLGEPAPGPGRPVLAGGVLAGAHRSMPTS